MQSFDAIRPTQHIQPTNHNYYQPKKPKRRWKWFLLLLVVLLGLGAWSAYDIFSRTNKIFTGNGNFITRITKLLTNSSQPLTGEDQGQVNILLLGIGGEGHDGANLTDTMLVASINTATDEVTLISIPRDFIIQSTTRGFEKINAAYAYAEQAKTGSGGLAAIAAAEKVTGLTIPYYAVVDFKGFVKAVDHLGGLDVTVDRTFTDNTFPNDFPYDTKGYLSPITFKKGPQHMDGRTALIFARSRHSPDNGEGSDFARSERQKKILVAMKEKVLKLGLTDIKTINNLLTDFTDNVRTNIEPSEIKRMTDLAGKINSNSIYSFSLEPQDNLICAGMIEDYTSRAYVIQPCEGKTLADIHEYLKSATTMAKLKKEGATIEVQNSTGKVTTTTKWAKMNSLGTTVNFVGFKGKVPYEQTILYDNSHGSKPNTLNYLKTNYTYTTSDVTYPSSNADFVIIIGRDEL